MLKHVLLSLTIIGFCALSAENPQFKDIQAIKQEVKECNKEKHALFKMMAGTMQAFQKHPFILSILPTLTSVAIPALIKKPLVEPLAVAIGVYTTSVVGSRYLLPSIMEQLNIKKI